jgi:hypothetical protein
MHRAQGDRCAPRRCESGDGDSHKRFLTVKIDILDDIETLIERPRSLDDCAHWHFHWRVTVDHIHDYPVV